MGKRLRKLTRERGLMYDSLLPKILAQTAFEFIHIADWHPSDPFCFQENRLSGLYISLPWLLLSYRMLTQFLILPSGPSTPLRIVWVHAQHWCSLRCPACHHRGCLCFSRFQVPRVAARTSLPTNYQTDNLAERTCKYWINRTQCFVCLLDSSNMQNLLPNHTLELPEFSLKRIFLSFRFQC